jgi:hypothetical protein
MPRGGKAKAITRPMKKVKKGGSKQTIKIKGSTSMGVR